MLIFQISKSRFLSLIILLAFTCQSTMAFAQPTDFVRISLAYSSAGNPADATLFFGSLNGDDVMAGGPALFEGHLLDYETGTNHPYSVEIAAETLADITIDPTPALEDSDEQIYNIYQGGERVPVTLRMATSADPLKANSYVHTGTFHFEDTGKIVTFSALNDPIPVVVLIGGGAVLLICGTNIVQELVDACADRAARACAPNGVRTCKAEITAWSLIRGCDSNCTFTCWPPPTVDPKQVDYEEAPVQFRVDLR